MTSSTRATYFPDSFRGVNGLARASRQCEAFFRSRECAATRKLSPQRWNWLKEQLLHFSDVHAEGGQVDIFQRSRIARARSLHQSRGRLSAQPYACQVDGDLLRLCRKVATHNDSRFPGCLTQPRENIVVRCIQHHVIAIAQRRLRASQFNQLLVPVQQRIEIHYFSLDIHSLVAIRDRKPRLASSESGVC